MTYQYYFIRNRRPDLPFGKREMAKKEKEKKHGFSEGNRMLAALAFNLLVILICTFFFVPEVINNDDYIIHSITSGAYGKASPELAHTNILYGQFLVAMQSWFPAFNWFELFNYALLFLSTSFLSYCIWDRNRNAAGAVLAAAFVLFVGPQCYLQLHNSKVIPYIAAAGLYAVLFGWEKKKAVWCVFGVLLSVIAAFVRFHAFLIGAAFVFVCCVIRLIGLLKEADRKQALRDAGRMVLAFAVVFAIIFGTYFWDRHVEATDETLRDYRQYNLARGAVSDYDLPDFAANYVEFQDIGISENDLQMIRIWDFADLEKFSADVLLRIAQMRGDTGRENVPGRFVREILSGLVGNSLFTAVFLMAAVNLVFSARKQGFETWVVLLVFLLCLLYMCLGGRTTRWVTAGLCLAALAALFCTVRWRKGSLSTVVSVILLLCVGVLDAITVLPHAGDYSTYFNRGAMRIYSDLGERQENLYLMDSDCSPPLQRTVPTFSAVEPDLCRNVYVLGGWDTCSDAKDSILDRYHVFRSPYRALLERRNVFLCDMHNAPVILRYLRENYSPNATMSMVETVDGYYIFAFTNQRVKTNNTSIEILDASSSIDTQFGNYLYVGAVFDTDVTQIDAVYLELVDRSEIRHLYRASAFDRDDGHHAAVLWAPLTDLPDVSDLKIRVLIEDRFDSVFGSRFFGEEEPAEEETISG